MRGLSRGPHITRYFMYKRLRAVGDTLKNKGGDVLAISRSHNLCDVLGLQDVRITEANFPEQSLLDLTFPDESFDFVLSDQVLEHVEGDPQRAVNESWRVLRRGGIALHTTCFINPIHEYPKDFWRFTPKALELLATRFSRIIACEGWGNFEAWLVIRDNLRFDGIPHVAWHPLHRLAMKNDPEWPIVTWIVAEK
jgi:ubiquinone/menaquinone biosynthesis C-methylase UbiE